MQAVKAQLITKEKNSSRTKQGVAGWVAMAIEVQIAQCVSHLVNSPDNSPVLTHPFTAESNIRLFFADTRTILLQLKQSIWRRRAKLLPREWWRCNVRCVHCFPRLILTDTMDCTGQTTISRSVYAKRTVLVMPWRNCLWADRRWTSPCLSSLPFLFRPASPRDHLDGFAY